MGRAQAAQRTRLAERWLPFSQPQRSVQASPICAVARHVQPLMNDSGPCSGASGLFAVTCRSNQSKLLLTV